ncbi:hypothetical protein [Cohnella candidum]|uniref:S-layer protein n=1 Tax=Cohnella candidum TaxID=2674991 RepID=A0A3G3K145_9BACL|nr:hypothetical protein [Cohnella candidum]AYQ74178.1 hypothetical protein EAV92_17370 [Cohnella candidum]
MRVAFRKGALFALITIILLVTYSSAFAATQPSKVSLGGSSNITIKQVDLINSGSSNVLGVTVSIFNGGKSDLQLIDYWLKVVNKNGDKYSVKISDQDKSKTKVAPNSTVEQTYFAEIDKSATIKQLTIQIIKWNFSQTNFETVLGTIDLSKAASTVAASGTKKTLTFDKVQVSTLAGDLYVTERDGYYNVSLDYDLENIGQRKLTIPDTIKYYLQTPNGNIYQLTSSQTSVSIEAKGKQTIQLTAEVPSTNTNVTTSKLVVALSDQTNKVDIPIASYQLKGATQTSNSAGKAIQFRNKYGLYEVKLVDIQRLPWNDQDILAAEFEVKNPGKTSLSVPVLSGYYTVDGVNMGRDATKLVQLDKIITLKPGETSKQVVYAKIPYTYEYSEVQLNVENIESTTTKTTDTGTTPDTTQGKSVAVFKVKASDLKLPLIPKNQAYALTDVGKRADVIIKDSYIYEGTATDMFYGSVVMRNNEKRPSTLTTLEGFVEAQDGAIFPAKISQVKTTVGPSGEALLAFRAEIPKAYGKQALRVMIGQGVTGTGLTTGDAAADAFVRAVELQHDTPIATVASSLKEISLYPYVITLSKIYGTYDSSSIDLELNADIKENSQYSVIPEKHKLGIEITSGTYSTIKEYDFNDVGETDAAKLSVGNSGLKITVSEPGVLNKLSTSFDYTINVYDIFDGHKRLLATKKLNWFENSDK